MIIKNLIFIKTCGACPEQYDVMTEDNNIVGYVRLRFGALTCEYPDVGGEMIYSAFFDDDFMGSFDDAEQRNYYLNIVADKILEKLKEERNV